MTPVPKIREVRPTMGPVGAEVIIYGEGFFDGSVVAFNGVRAKVVGEEKKEAQQGKDAQGKDKAPAGQTAQAKQDQAKQGQEGDKKSQVEELRKKAAQPTDRAPDTGGGAPNLSQEDLAKMSDEDREMAGLTKTIRSGLSTSEVSKLAETNRQDPREALAGPGRETAITVTVPEGATTGDITVSYDGVVSNGSRFVVAAV